MSQPWKLVVDKIADGDRITICGHDGKLILQVHLGSDQLGPEVQYVNETLLTEGARILAAIAAMRSERQNDHPVLKAFNY